MQLHRDRASFVECGVRLVLIGQATPSHAAHFRRMMGIELPVLADEERVSYRAAGAKTAMMDELLGPAVVAKGVVAMARHSVVQGRQIGDFAQLGGAMLIATNADVVWAHMAKDASDNASPDEILGAYDASRRDAQTSRYSMHGDLARGEQNVRHVRASR